MWGEGAVGFIADVGVNLAVARVMPGKAGMLVGGAAGGAAHEVADDIVGGRGLSVDGAGDILKSAVGGAVANGVLGYGAGRVGKGVGAAAKRAEKSITPELNRLDLAAKRAAERANKLRGDLSSYQSKLDNWGRFQRKVKIGNKNLSKDELKDLIKSTRARISKSEASARRYSDKHKNTAADKHLDQLKKWEERLKSGQGKFASSSNAAAPGVANRWLRALGSAGVVQIAGGDEPGGGKGGQGQDVPEITFVWVGEGAAGSQYGEKPFVEDEKYTTEGGSGFLLQPSKGLSPQVEKWYGHPTDSVAKAIADGHKLFGDPKLKSKIEDDKLKMKDVAIPRLSAAGSGIGKGGAASEYGKLVGKLNDKADLVDAAQVNVVNVLPKVEDITKEGRENYAELIRGMNVNVSQMHAPTTNEEMLRMLMQAMVESAEEIEGANKLHQAQAERVEKQKETLEDDRARDDDLKNSVDRSVNNAQDPSYTPDPVKSGITDPSLLPDTTPGDINTPGTSAEDLQNSVGKQDDEMNEALENATNPATDSAMDPATNPSLASPASTGSLGSMGSMGSPGGVGDLMGQMQTMQTMEMMRRMAEARNGADPDLASRAKDIDPARYDRAAAPTMPQQQPGSTPWSNQPASTGAPAQAQNAHHPAGPPNGANSTQAGGGAPARVAGDDGLVPYQLPDGRSQRVPLAAAQGLDKGFANKTGTDAQAAYQGTAAAWTDPKDIGLAVDPFGVATGDVATWRKSSKDKPDTESSGDPEFRTAIVVRFGDPETGTLEVLVNGELQPFSPDMTDDAGAFGDFAGFKHPKGMEAAGDKGQDTGVPADQGTDAPAMAPA
ncbi:hypothetical protein [Nocardia sp. NPDC019395]|uniref:hypothetical protein n=1 Tax=Nocardia sp. NPDC019395 TaxID=3154686 RepID=UPI0033DD9053